MPLLSSRVRLVPDWIFGALIILLTGAIALPMLPVWQGGLRVLAGCTVLVCVAMPRIVHRVLAVGLAALLAFAGISWLTSMASSPVDHVIHALTDVFGQTLGLAPDAALLVYDSIVVGALLYALTASGEDRVKRAFAFALGAFFGWAVLGWGIRIGLQTEPFVLARMATGVSGWATWIYWAVLFAMSLSSGERLRCAMQAIGLGALAVGVVIALQLCVNDSSYVIAAISGVSEGFQRVRGTDYYHAPAAFVAGFGALAWMALTNGRGRWLAWVAAVGLLAVMFLDNTRAVSLALTCGLATLLAGLLFRREWLGAFVVGIALVVVAQNVVYLKPSLTKMPPESARVTDVAEPRSGAAGPTTVAAVATANAARSSLAQGGLRRLSSAGLLGSGVGTLDLPLEGNSFNGLLSTYSTHVLYLDVALMAGLPALAAFLAIFAVAGWGSGLRLRADEEARIRIVALSMLLSFLVVSLFLPQERNELIGVAFAVAGIAVAAVARRQMGTDDRRTLALPRIALTMLFLSTLGWALLTSPRYVFPVIELAGRYGADIVREKQLVYVNEPYFRPLLTWLLRLRGADSDRVRVLDDSTPILSLDGVWILWNPMSRSAFPHLVASLGPPRHLHRNQALAITLPPNWWLMPSAQPVVSFIFAGARRTPALLARPDAESAPRVLPNYAPFAGIRIGKNVSGAPAQLADFNFGSVVYWPAEEGAEVSFAVPEMSSTPLRIYRLTAMANRSMPKLDAYGWVLEGSDDGASWTKLDRREGVTLSQDASAPSSFSLHGSQSFANYRLRFDAGGHSAGLAAGLSEIEMYFAPSDRAGELRVSK
jgi:hypothetical protein